jgi:hypothetical protein
LRRLAGLGETAAMLFRSNDLKAIVGGSRTLVFPRWKRP